MGVTIQDLAKLTGLGTSTISRVLSDRGYVSPETKQLVEAAVRQTGYVYKPTTIRTPIKMTMIVMGEMSNRVFGENMLGIASVFDACGEKYVGAYGERDKAEILEDYMRQAIRNHFKGMILLSPIETPTFIRMMRNCVIPCVAMNRSVEHVDMNCVCMNNKAAGRMAVEYLASKGHKRIAFVYEEKRSSVEYRRQGYLEAMKKLGLEINQGDMICIKPTYEEGVQAGIWLAENSDITAVYTPNEWTARSVIDGLRLRGKKVPEEVSIMATDNSHYSVSGLPALTTVSCSHFQMGVEAAHILQAQWNDPKAPKQKIFLMPEIIERESVLCL